MALIKFGGGITEMRGSIGGNVFSRNRSGAIVRQRTTPVNPQTNRQSAARAIMASVAATWLGVLTAVQRTAWNLYAASVPATNKLGEVINLSGFNQYCKSSAASLNAGLPAIADGPTIFTLPGEDATFAVAVSEATQLATITFDEPGTWEAEDGGAMIIQVGQPQNPSIEFFNGPWRQTTPLLSDSGTPLTSPLTTPLPYAATEGQKIFIRARILRADGRLGDWFRDVVIGGA